MESDGTDPDSSSASPAEKTSTRTYGSAHRVPQKRPLSQAFKHDVAVLRGVEGLTQGSAGKVLGVSAKTISRTEHDPDVQEEIKVLRERWKGISQTRVDDMAGDTWSMAKDFVALRDSKQFDNTMRGIAAMEKVSASVSGEGQKVEMIGVPPSTPQIELRILIGQLLGISSRGA